MTVDERTLITRREAIQRVGVLLGGITFIGGSSLLTACERRGEAGDGPVGEFTREDIAFLDEIAETILPETSTPGAKAAKTGAFMALMVTDSYREEERQRFREGMRALDQSSRDEFNASFMEATPAQRLQLLERLDREQRAQSRAREAAWRKDKGLAPIQRAEEETEPKEARGAEAQLPGQRQEAAPGANIGAAAAITAETPTHYFRMMKELALLGYFTSEIGCTQAQRYIESPGRFDPCVPYAPGEKAWAPHA